MSMDYVARQDSAVPSVSFILTENMAKVLLHEVDR
jgi:hypothetical protein